MKEKIREEKHHKFLQLPLFYDLHVIFVGFGGPVPPLELLSCFEGLV